MNVKDLLAKKLQENQASHERARSLNVDQDPLQIIEIPLSKIETNPFQPRSVFNQDAIHSLAESIEKEGLLQPILVRPNGVKGYQLVSGERRFRAFQALDRTVIPASIMSKNNQESAVAALHENLKRESLTDFEVGCALETIFDLIQEDEGKLPSKKALAERLGLSRASLNRYVAFHGLPEGVREVLKQDPELLSGSVAQVLQSWAKKNSVGDEYEESILEALMLVRGGELIQSGIMAFIEQYCASISDESEGSIELESSVEKKSGGSRGKKSSSEVLEYQGHKVGRWKVSGDRVEVSLKSSLLDDEKVKALRAYLDVLLGEE